MPLNDLRGLDSAIRSFRPRDRRRDEPCSNNFPQIEPLLAAFRCAETDVRPRSALFFGPPGTGKSAAARRLATECGLAFLVVRPSDVMSQWVGDSEKRMNHIFRSAHAARPCIIFFDEADALLCNRGGSAESEVMRRLKTEALMLLQSASEMPEELFIVAATNIPWELDPAILRRFDSHVFFDLPDSASRCTLVRANCPLARSVVSDFAAELRGCSCSEVIAACRSLRLKMALTPDADVRSAAKFCARRQHRAAREDDLERYRKWGNATVE